MHTFPQEQFMLSLVWIILLYVASFKEKNLFVIPSVLFKYKFLRFGKFLSICSIVVLMENLKSK